MSRDAHKLVFDVLCLFEDGNVLMDDERFRFRGSCQLTRSMLRREGQRIDQDRQTGAVRAADRLLLLQRRLPVPDCAQRGVLLRLEDAPLRIEKCDPICR